MTPIHALLNRIRWDREFDRGDLVDYEGVVHSIPLPWIKEFYKDGEWVWYREH